MSNARIPRLAGIARTAGIAGAAAFLAVAAVAGCARQWPADPGAPDRWQLVTGPLNLVPGQSQGRMVSAFAYASERVRPPSCDGVGEDDCAFYEDRLGRHLPARLAVTCWDPRGDRSGTIDVTFTPSRPVLDNPGLHPRSWEGWVLDFDGPAGPRDVIVDNGGQIALADGFVPFVDRPGQVGESLDYLRERAGRDDAEVTVTATFAEDEARAPLQWRFKLDGGSGAGERLRAVLENCGRRW